MKRIVSGLLAFALVLGLCACSNSAPESIPSNQAGSTVSTNKSDTDKKVVLTGMVWGSTENHEKMTKELFKAAPELANKYEIKWVVGGEGDKNVAEKIRLALSSNEAAADFVQLNYTQVPEFAQAGTLTDVSTSIDQYKGNLVSGATAISNYQGKTVAFPFELKPRIWFYRSDIFKEAGVDVTQIKNVDGLIAAGKKIQAIHPKTYIWNFGPTAAAYDFYMCLSGNGARFSDDKGNYNIASDPGVRAMLKDYKKLVDAGVVMNVSDFTTDWENALSQGILVSQLSAGWLAQNSLLPTYAKGQEGKWAAAAWPELGGSTGGSDAGGSVFVIPTFSEHPKEAADFLAHLTLSKEGTLAIFDTIAATPINTEALKDKKVTMPNAFFGDSLLKAQMKGLDNLKVFNYSPKAVSEMNIVNEYFIKAVYSKMPIDTALQQAERDLKQTNGNANG